MRPPAAQCGTAARATAVRRVLRAPARPAKGRRRGRHAGHGTPRARSRSPPAGRRSQTPRRRGVGRGAGILAASLPRGVRLPDAVHAAGNGAARHGQPPRMPAVQRSVPSGCSVRQPGRQRRHRATRAAGHGSSGRIRRAGGRARLMERCGADRGGAGGRAAHANHDSPGGPGAGHVSRGPIGRRTMDARVGRRVRGFARIQIWAGRAGGHSNGNAARFRGGNRAPLTGKSRLGLAVTSLALAIREFRSLGAARRSVPAAAGPPGRRRTIRRPCAEQPGDKRRRARIGRFECAGAVWPEPCEQGGGGPGRAKIRNAQIPRPESQST